MTPLSLLLAAGLGLSLAGCTSDPPDPICLEKDTQAAAVAFAACAGANDWANNNHPITCRKAADEVACRRWASPLPAAQGGR